MEVHEIQDLQAELATVAEREGFTLGRVYIEHIRSASSSFDGLVDAVKRSEVRDVIVPSLRHFARYPELQQAMKTYLAREAGVRIWIARQSPARNDRR